MKLNLMLMKRLALSVIGAAGLAACDDAPADGGVSVRGASATDPVQEITTCDPSVDPCGSECFVNGVAPIECCEVDGVCRRSGCAFDADCDCKSDGECLNESGCAVAGLSDPDCAAGVCPRGPVGGVDLGALPDYLLVFANGSTDANWQGATKGFAGDVAVDGVVAKERTSGGVPFAGTVYSSDTTLGAWQNIVGQSNNTAQASKKTGESERVGQLADALREALVTIDGLTVTRGYESRGSTSLNGLDTRNGVKETLVINVTSGFQVSSKINITGDAGDIFILRWDTDAAPENGYQGQVKFQSGGAIVPLGGLTAGSFIHVAGDINASGGGSNPAAPYPQGPRLLEGSGALIKGGNNFNGGGFFTGYWLTTGAPRTGETASLSNAIFVGGWYSLTTKFSMTSGTSGVHVCPRR